MPVRTVVQRGPKGKKAVAFAVDWPGWSRGAKTPEAALDLVESYRERYRGVAVAADFWGMSFCPSGLEHEPMDDTEADRNIGLLRACWEFFDAVGSRVSAQMRKGPRGGGRDRDEIIRHTIRTETEDFAKRVGLRVPENSALTPEGLRDYRVRYVSAMRVRPPSVSGDSLPWEDLDHRTYEQVPAGVAGPSGADGRGGQAGLRLAVGGDLRRLGQARDRLGRDAADLGAPR